MSKGLFEKAEQKCFLSAKVILAILVFCLFAIFLLFYNQSNSRRESQKELQPTQLTVEKNPDSIAIPGYEILELNANSKEQALCLPNPEQNMCYFQIALYLEDGTLLWQSELIEPGKTSKPMVLTKTLSKGTYPQAVLRYACYRMDEDLSPLNGAETKVTLRVK